jgi:hypothetical protein
MTPNKNEAPGLSSLRHPIWIAPMLRRKNSGVATMSFNQICKNEFRAHLL